MESIKGQPVIEVHVQPATLAPDAGDFEAVVTLSIGTASGTTNYRLAAACAIDLADDLHEAAVGAAHDTSFYQILTTKFGIEFEEVTRLLDERWSAQPVSEQETRGVGVPVVESLPAEGRLAQLRAVDGIVFAWVGDRWEPVPMMAGESELAPEE